MSQDVEMVRDFFAAYNARDIEAVDRLLAPDAEVTTLSARAGLAARWERGETRRYFEQLDEAWTDLRVEIEDYHESGDRVVAVGIMRGIGKTSNVEIARSFGTRSRRATGLTQEAVEVVPTGASLAVPPRCHPYVRERHHRRRKPLRQHLAGAPIRADG
jgi:ketosteroid isomerase-like protein